VSDAALPEYLTEADLARYGLDAADVRRLAPCATEYRALDGSHCWAREALEPRLSGRGGEE
jgi:hypothetical protein